MTAKAKLKINKTIGGYKVENFTKLEKPISKGNLEPHIYKGVVKMVPRLYNKTHQDYETTWDKNGRCSNYFREDCFIDLSVSVKTEITKI